MFFRLSGESGASLHRDLILPLAMASANFLLLLPLALRGVGLPAYPSKITLTGIALILFTVFIHLPKGNEHSLSNAAQVLLAIPAGAALASIRRRPLALALCAAFLPMTAGTLIAFASRPPMPIATAAGQIHRLPPDGDLESLYDWTRRNTTPNAIFLTDTQNPVKMSGNTSEFPAFTSRTLFADAENLTEPYRDAGFRRQLETQATHGQPLTATQRAYLARFHRPLYLLTYEARDLSALYGAPQFQHGIATVYRIQP
jgi:hypothetical protein